ncbi:hypothetical protein K435DRAFT_800521 [Dendrothele bispora CBS 962.96]|uniref:Uncharacterized protein n=1 Tax=Dendrothele bispora (strain CBS 962.96) TaxID=1314807 RepID=A0A4V4HET4_DENBC|nr:hypothetical protein K435DRAFT_800521 [Dendrothele bispora CBS 962.96]
MVACGPSKFIINQMRSNPTQDTRCRLWKCFKTSGPPTLNPVPVTGVPNVELQAVRPANSRLVALSAQNAEELRLEIDADHAQPRHWSFQRLGVGTVQEGFLEARRESVRDVERDVWRWLCGARIRGGRLKNREMGRTTRGINERVERPDAEKWVGQREGSIRGISKLNQERTVALSRSVPYTDACNPQVENPNVRSALPTSRPTLYRSVAPSAILPMELFVIRTLENRDREVALRVLESASDIFGEKLLMYGCKSLSLTTWLHRSSTDVPHFTIRMYTGTGTMAGSMHIVPGGRSEGWFGSEMRRGRKKSVCSLGFDPLRHTRVGFALDTRTRIPLKYEPEGEIVVKIGRAGSET